MSIHNYRQTYTQTASAVLAEAASVGDHAPSIHNTRPWRWRVDGETLELYAEPTRHLPASDPGGRQSVLSCGAALHHARAALAAQGWRVEVERMPVPDRPRLLAWLRLPGRLSVTRDAMRLLQTIRIRHTDRQAVPDTPVTSGDIDPIRSAAAVEQAWLHPLRPQDVLDLAIAAGRARMLEEFDPQWGDEIAYWTGLNRIDGSTSHEDPAAYEVLYGLEDTPTAWLRAGEALSAAWLAATERGVPVLPLGAAVEVETTRVVVRRLLAHLGEPFLVLRFGTSRLPTVQTVGEAGSTRQ
jgi:nitroreductase